MQRSESVANLNEAFVKWLNERPKLVKDAEVTVRPSKGKPYSFRYATLGNIISTYEKSLSNNGLMVSQEVTDKGVYTFVEHSSGEWKTYGPLQIVVGDNVKEQQTGSSITYKKRYQLESALFLDAVEDDDANIADDNEVQDKKQAKPKEKSQSKQQKSTSKKQQQQKSEPKKQQSSGNTPAVNADDQAIQEWIDSITTQEDSEKLVEWYQKGLNSENGKEFEKKWKKQVMQKMQEL